MTRGQMYGSTPPLKARVSVLTRNCRIVPSAVIVPEVIEQPASPEVNTQPRRFSSSEGPNKQQGPEIKEAPAIPKLQALGQEEESIRSPPYAVGRSEERKRGKRLFGALLGTLAGSSPSPVHKRRMVIEEKQQTKLKLQAEQYNEKKRHRLDLLREVRRQEQRKYLKQSVDVPIFQASKGFPSLPLVDANMPFQPLGPGAIPADQGRTKASRSLTLVVDTLSPLTDMQFYMPWKLRPEDAVRIKSQIDGVITTICNETFGSKSPTSDDTMIATHDGKETMRVTEPETCQVSTTMGSEVSRSGINVVIRAICTDEARSKSIESKSKIQGAAEEFKDHSDEAGEVVVEAREDTVIY